MHHGPRDWKSAAADRLHRMGLGDSARALYGIKKQQPQADEMLSHELRAEGLAPRGPTEASPQVTPRPVVGLVQLLGFSFTP